MKHIFDESLEGLNYRRLKGSDAIRAYLGVNGWGIIALTFALLSWIILFGIAFAFLPVLGISIGLYALYKHLDSPEEYGGYYFALSGIILSMVFIIGGTGWNIWNYYYSVPSGYRYVEFDGMAIDPKTKKIPSEIIQLAKEQKRVYIKGYMYQDQQMSNLTSFVMVRTKEHCKFCSPHQNPADMITVHLNGGLKVNYRNKPISVGGILYVNEDFQYGDLPYHLEADIVK